MSNHHSISNTLTPSSHSVNSDKELERSQRAANTNATSKQPLFQLPERASDQFPKGSIQQPSAMETLQKEKSRLQRDGVSDARMLQNNPQKMQQLDRDYTRSQSSRADSRSNDDKSVVSSPQKASTHESGATHEGDGGKNSRPQLGTTGKKTEQSLASVGENHSRTHKDNKTDANSGGESNSFAAQNAHSEQHQVKNAGRVREQALANELPINQGPTQPAENARLAGNLAHLQKDGMKNAVSTDSMRAITSQFSKPEQTPVPQASAINQGGRSLAGETSVRSERSQRDHHLLNSTNLGSSRITSTSSVALSEPSPSNQQDEGRNKAEDTSNRSSNESQQQTPQESRSSQLLDRSSFQATQAAQNSGSESSSRSDAPMRSEMIQNIMRQIERFRESGRSAVNVNIPNEHGEDIRMTLRMSDQRLQVKLHTQDPQLQESIEEGWDTLKSQASDAGIQLATPLFQEPVSIDEADEQTTPRNT